MTKRTIIAAASLAGAFLMASVAAQQPPMPRTTAPRPAPRAQQPAAPPAPAAPVEGPQRTSASYGDWVVRCEITTTQPPQKNCDMEQLAQMQGQANPISRVAIPLPAKGQPARLIIQVPVNVSLSAPVRISADNKDHLTVAFHRCIPAGCFADTELKEEEIRRFRVETAAGKLLYKDSGDRDVTIPLSFKGFGQAFDALVKQ
ncbi:MAG TPA: invasion associated locus B family protein [Xanthobacteraceae bacterium]|nr:invasion associated locus B family protein [Xanthobacteraceae bacterium]